MQEKQLEEHHVVCKVDDHMQIMIKGKRTKRQRLITMTSSSENSGTAEEEEDMMANSLILLAQGHHHHLHTQKKSSSHHVPAPHNNNNNNNNKKKEKLYLYQCKTCNRCFSSFQALGGHRVSHKKIPKSNTAVTTTFVNDYNGPTNTTLTLQLSNRAMYSNHNTMTSSKSKVHECSICEAEFTSGQALGGHMRRHRSTSSLSMRSNIIRSPQTHEAKIHGNVLKLDLNLPAPEDDDDDDKESKFPFQSKEKVIAFSANSLVDCHTEVQV